MKLYEAVKNEKFIELVNNECKWIGDNQIEDRIDEILDETNETIKIGTLEYSPSEVLKSVDPVAYKTVISDYVDSLLSDEELIEVDGNYYNYNDVYALFEREENNLEESLQLPTGRAS